MCAWLNVCVLAYICRRVYVHKSACASCVHMVLLFTFIVFRYCKYYVIVWLTIYACFHKLSYLNHFGKTKTPLEVPFLLRKETKVHTLHLRNKHARFLTVTRFFVRILAIAADAVTIVTLVFHRAPVTVGGTGWR